MRDNQRQVSSVENTRGAQGEAQETPHSRGVSLASALLILAVSFGAVAQGGFHPNQFRVLIAILAAALVTALLSGSHRSRVSWHPLLSTAAALAASAGLSAWVAGDAADALPAVGLLAGMAAAVVAARRSGPAERALVLAAVVAVGTLTAFAGWVGVVFRREPLALVHEGLWRASSTITYANATAGFLLLPALLALGRTVHKQGRKVWSLASYLLVVGILATLSRAGLLALGAGVATLAFMSHSSRRTVAALWPVAVGGGIAVLGLLSSAPARVAAKPQLSVAAFAAGAAVVVLAPQASRRARVLLLVASIGPIALGIQNLRSAGHEITSTRLTAATDDRIGAWGAALRLSARHPALGAGPAKAVIEYRSTDGELVTSRYVHNEYLQLLAEQGGVGVAVLLGGMVLTSRRLARTRHTLPDSNWTGSVAALAALGVHSAGDFLWHVPAIPLTTAVILGLLADDGQTAKC
jgi:O-antigen ligase